MRRLAVGLRYQAVLFSPDHQGGQSRGEVHLVECVHRLTAIVDHRSQGPQERGPGLRISERTVGVPGLVDLRTAQAERAQPATHSFTELDDALRCDDRQHEFRSRRRHQPQRATEFRSEAAAADQHQPFDVLRMLMGKLHRDAAAE